MNDLPIYLGMLAFAAMGIGALLRPAAVLGQFGILELTSAARSEVRAVYGGFGCAIAGVLALALHSPALRSGILLTVAVALLGMAAGRLVSAVIDRSVERVPLCYFALEILVGLLLL